MVREIGSEFWIDKNETSETSSETPLWLKRLGNIVLTSSGRGAISLALNQIKPKIKRALLPSYVCDSVIIPFEKAGYELIYYDLDEYFTPQNIDIESVEIGVFLHMGYFGFHTNGKLVDLISTLRAKAVVIIEDVTHTLFSSYTRVIENDFIVGSIRKWFGVPSGGFLAAESIIEVELENHQGMFIDLRTNGLLKKFDYVKSLDISLKCDYLQHFRDAEKLLDKDTQFYKIDEISKQKIKYFDSDHLINSRIQNYKFLLEHLQNIDGIEIIFDDLYSDVCPMFFPIYVKRGRDKLRFDLINKEIYCPIHWPIPERLKDHLNNKTEKIYNSILSIPCDQRYSVDDMLRIINSIKELI